MSYESQQCTPLWSPDLYGLGLPPGKLCLSFVCGRLTAVDGLVGMAGFQSGWLPGPALC